jgi:FkbM family methyltransferase
MNLSVIQNYFNPEKILDIGANIGQFYLDCVEVYPNSYYHLIEGNDYCEENLKSLGVDFSITLLSDSEKEVDFYIRKHEIKCTGNSIYREKTNFFKEEEIEIIKKKTSTLESIFSKTNFDLIKIDVQGSELDIIKGGLNIVKNAKGIILEVSLTEYNEGSPLKNEVIKFMDEIGFYPAETIGYNGHPETHEQIQEDILFLRKKNKIALMTVLFDYPDYYLPTFYENALKSYNQEDIHIVRFNKLIDSESYYDKLFYYKVIGLLEYIESHVVGKYDYILFLDATDTNFISSPNNIIDSFKEYDCSVLLGAEYGLWPPTNYEHLYDSKPKLTDKFYLNSGTYIGYTDKVIYHLKDIIEKKYQENIDDQGRWSIQYLLNDDIKIDQECKIFFSTYLSKKDVTIDGDKAKLNNLEACIIHDNGPHGDETIKLVNHC